VTDSGHGSAESNDSCAQLALPYAIVCSGWYRGQVGMDATNLLDMLYSDNRMPDKI